MQSRGGDEFDFEDWGSVNAPLPPWSDDEPTTAWSRDHWEDLQPQERASTHALEARPASAIRPNDSGWFDKSSGWDDAPIVISVEDAPRPTARAHDAMPPVARQPTSRQRLSTANSQAAPDWHAAAARASQQLAAQARARAPARGLPHQAQRRAAQARATNPQPRAAATQTAPQARAEMTAQLRPAARPRLAQPPLSLLPPPPLELDRSELERPKMWKAAAWYTLAAVLGLAGAEYFARSSMPPRAPPPVAVIAPNASAPAAPRVEPAPLVAAEVVDALPSIRTPTTRRPSQRASAHAAWNSRASSHPATASQQRERERLEPREPARPTVEPTAGAVAEAPVAPRESPALTSTSADPGTLRINSRPWSQVFVDGRLVGDTPQQALRMSPGTHEVRLLNPEFAMSKTFSVTIRAGENLTRVENLGE